MRRSLFPAASLLAVFLIAAAPHTVTAQDDNRRALVAALELRIATGEHVHMSHDQGEWLQRAVDAAIARGDQEIEHLAVRAASPLSASIDRPVSSSDELSGIGFDAQNALRVRRPVAYTARIEAS